MILVDNANALLQYSSSKYGENFEITNVNLLFALFIIIMHIVFLKVEGHKSRSVNGL